MIKAKFVLPTAAAVIKRNIICNQGQFIVFQYDHIFKINQ